MMVFKMRDSVPSRDIPAFVMYCVYGASRSYLFIESTDSVIYISGAHEPPVGQQGASNYVQLHLTMSGSDTFLVWTFPQVGNLLLWTLRVRVFLLFL